MLNRSASLAMSTSVLKALPGKLDIKRHSPSILYLFVFSICGSLRFCIDVIKVPRQKIDFAWSMLIKKVPNIKITAERVYFKDDPIRIEHK